MRRSTAPRTAITCSAGWNRRGRGWRLPPMRKRYPFDYAVVRIVPRVDRGEFLNAGVIVFSSTAAFLGARIELDRERLIAFAPEVGLALVEWHLAAIPQACSGGARAGAVAGLCQCAA